MAVKILLTKKKLNKICAWQNKQQQQKKKTNPKKQFKIEVMFPLLLPMYSLPLAYSE